MKYEKELTIHNWSSDCGRASNTNIKHTTIICLKDIIYSNKNFEVGGKYLHAIRFVISVLPVCRICLPLEKGNFAGVYWST